jgi:hypothetical protein
MVLDLQAVILVIFGVKMHSFTCCRNCGIVAYEGKKGGPMSGWSKNNMNQLF